MHVGGDSLDLQPRRGHSIASVLLCHCCRELANDMKSLQVGAWWWPPDEHVLLVVWAGIFSRSIHSCANRPMRPLIACIDRAPSTTVASGPPTHTQPHTISCPAAPRLLTTGTPSASTGPRSRWGRLGGVSLAAEPVPCTQRPEPCVASSLVADSAFVPLCR